MVYDVTDFTYGYYGHQTHCAAGAPDGLALAVFAKLPKANTYKDRERSGTSGVLGTVDLIGGRVFNMNAQFVPGKPRQASWWKTTSIGGRGTRL